MFFIIIFQAFFGGLSNKFDCPNEWEEKNIKQIIIRFFIVVNLFFTIAANVLALAEGAVKTPASKSAVV
ncbi:hypothetical protein C3K47_19285 [Solitalea longa]|uniref:Uncharacterized protein n=1 Tax=Solitalea longa TaxID=2079460 RepID=A0A2S4ZXM0_9SPHI|nr:hypothetical protein C3K47_19285 [Solitalea longa]